RAGVARAGATAAAGTRTTAGALAPRARVVRARDVRVVRLRRRGWSRLVDPDLRVVGGDPAVPGRHGRGVGAGRGVVLLHHPHVVVVGGVDLVHLLVVVAARAAEADHVVPHARLVRRRRYLGDRRLGGRERPGLVLERVGRGRHAGLGQAVLD